MAAGSAASAQGGPAAQARMQLESARSCRAAVTGHSAVQKSSGNAGALATWRIAPRRAPPQACCGSGRHAGVRIGCGIPGKEGRSAPASIRRQSGPFQNQEGSRVAPRAPCHVPGADCGLDVFRPFGAHARCAVPGGCARSGGRWALSGRGDCAHAAAIPARTARSLPASEAFRLESLREQMARGTS